MVIDDCGALASALAKHGNIALIGRNAAHAREIIDA